MPIELHDYAVFFPLGPERIATGEYQSGARWTKAEEEYRKAKSSKRRMPIIFGDARHNSAHLYKWALLDDLSVSDDGTSVRFSGVTNLRGRYSEDLRKESDGEPLSSGVRRGYSLVHTPDFLTSKRLLPSIAAAAKTSPSSATKKARPAVPRSKELPALNYQGRPEHQRIQKMLAELGELRKMHVRTNHFIGAGFKPDVLWYRLDPSEHANAAPVIAFEVEFGSAQAIAKSLASLKHAFDLGAKKLILVLPAARVSGARQRIGGAFHEIAEALSIFSIEETSKMTYPELAKRIDEPERREQPAKEDDRSPRPRRHPRKPSS